MSLGLGEPGEPMIRLPIRTTNSWEYFSDRFKYRRSSWLRYGSAYGKGDTVGCGINMQTGTIFFTKNGANLGKNCRILLHIRNGFFLGLKSLTNRLQKGVAFANAKGILFPIFGGLGMGFGISINFGKSSFVYDIAGHDWTVGDSLAAINGTMIGQRN